MEKANEERVLGPSDFIDPYKERGKKVQLNYREKDGTAYGNSAYDLEMMALYYNFEKTYLYWQNNFDLKIEDFGVSHINYNPAFVAKLRNIDILAKLKMNAAFIPGIRDLLFFKSSRIEALPIAANLSVMAHEFMHSVFDLYFAKKSQDFYSTESDRNDYILSAPE